MSEYVSQNNIQIAQVLFDFVNDRALPGTGVDGAQFWRDFANLLGDFAPRNAELLVRREKLQAQIDAWHVDHRAQPIDQNEYQAFLKDIAIWLRNHPHFPSRRKMSIPRSQPWPDRNWWCPRSTTGLS